MEEIGKQQADSKTLVPLHIVGMGTMLHGHPPVGGELCSEEMLSGQVKTAGFLQTRWVSQLLRAGFQMKPGLVHYSGVEPGISMALIKIMQK